MNSSTSKASASKGSNPKPHVCPPSDAKHPSDRWETAFVYAFIVKFTNLRSKVVEGFESQTDLEEAIMSPTQHPFLCAILSQFLRNLRPLPRNWSLSQLPATLSSVLQEYMKSSERTVFWNEELGMNEDPLQKVEGGIWGANWDLKMDKLRILRLLVELQLTHNQEIKDTIDRAWGVVHNKHRKRDTLTAPPDPSDPRSMERLSTTPIGQDSTRRRYWSFDDSPRLYVSTNPWKVTAEFKTIATTKEDYLKVVEELVATEPKETPRILHPRKLWTKAETQHNLLRERLQERVEKIDQELARIHKVRRKQEAKEMLRVQAELRSTRTRRQTHRPDYVYNQDFDDEEEGDEYTYQDDKDDELLDEDEFDDAISGRRRSQRTSTRNANGKRPSDASGEWRGERRSTRLGANPEVSEEPSAKRARTDERSISSAPSDNLISPVLSSNGTSVGKNGAAAVKGNEVAVEQVAGKKKSKFWFYAVEPAPNATAASEVPTDGVENLEINSHSRANGEGSQGSSGASIEGPMGQKNGDYRPHENGLPVMSKVDMA
ncbi:hypothetical protein EW145_g527 [Phellinidium pouzarii]|uniref:WHIM1 domain-containing protein n=1 Tax=Phellinidium pouzarii TaxID=167371 RepID=A0A4S4LII5_9AGAM|nr:hypothetical protein EW145_g527 [Phellinidium pouzarii]